MILTTTLLLVLGTITLYLVKCCCKKVENFRMLIRFPKPDDGNFFLGNMKALFQDNEALHGYLRKQAKNLYPQYCFRIAFSMGVNILSPEDAEIFMSTKKHSAKSLVYDVLKNWLKEGLLLSNGDKWMVRRKILTQAFHFNILKDFLNVFNEETQRLVENISSKCSEPIEVCALVTEYALCSVCETAMGYKLNVEDEKSKQYVQAIKYLGELLLHRMMRPWLLSFPTLYKLTPTYRKEVQTLNVLHEFTRNVINQRMESFDNTVHTPIENNADDDIFITKKKRRLAMLDVLLQAQKEDNSIDYEGICEEVDTFMFEGHDTTAAAMSFCLMLIANHPEVQERIVEEIRSVMKDGTSAPTYEDLKDMEYLERCIKESLRLYPSVFFISRTADEDTVLNSGLVVPKGTMVHIHIYDINRNPRTFPSPDKFDPDRFLPENIQDRHPFAYIPFSAGPRNCIGQRFALLEIKALLVGVLRKFVLTPVDTSESVVLLLNLVLRSKNGIRVKFNPRT